MLFCLQLDKMSRIPQEEFEAINWLLIKERYNQILSYNKILSFTGPAL